MALSLAGIVGLALGALAFYSAKRFIATATEAELSYVSRNAADTFSSDIRPMVSVSSFATNSITLVDLAGQTTVYSWNPSTRLFQRTRGSESKILLQECDSLSFSMYNANPIDGVLDIKPTTKIKECKAVKVQWTTARTNVYSASRTQINVAETVVLRFQGL